jgi:hypothetical protein
MFVINKSIDYYSRSDIFTLYPVFDTHIGARLCNEEKLKKTYLAIEKDDKAFWIHGGDGIEAINRSDWRYCETHLAGWCHGESDIIRLQNKRHIDLAAPIASKCLCAISGNHEKYLLKHYERDTYADFCDSLNIPQEERGTCGVLNLTFRRKSKRGTNGNQWRISLWLHHGYGGGKLEGGKALNLGRTMTRKAPYATIYIKGHVHNPPMWFPHATIGLDGKKHVKWGLIQASFLESYLPGCDSYAEEKEYDPPTTGCIPIKFMPDKRRFGFEVWSDL